MLFLRRLVCVRILAAAAPRRLMESPDRRRETKESLG
jgi:hypothetical protein